jgi:hypothetical protein
MFAIQMVLNLYATSVVTAVTFDAARMYAGAQSGEGSARDESAARAHISQLLGVYEQEGHLDVTFGQQGGSGGAPAVVTARVRATHPTQLLFWQMPYQTIDRTITVRAEELR